MNRQLSRGVKFYKFEELKPLLTVTTNRLTINRSPSSQEWVLFAMFLVRIVRGKKEGALHPCHISQQVRRCFCPLQVAHTCHPCSASLRPAVVIATPRVTLIWAICPFNGANCRSFVRHHIGLSIRPRRFFGFSSTRPAESHALHVHPPIDGHGDSHLRRPCYHASMATAA